MAEDRPKRPRGRPKTVDREHAIQVAMTAWWGEGLHSLSLNELCRRAGISKPALYREFGGEDGLMAAALAAYRQQAVAPLLAIVRAEMPFGDMLDRLVTVMTSDLGLPRGCLFTRMRLEDDRVGEGASEGLEALVAERRAAFAARYAAALEAGEAQASLTPDAAAHYWDTQLTTLLVQMAAGEDPETVRAEAKLALGVLLAV